MGVMGVLCWGQDGDLVLRSRHKVVSFVKMGVDTHTHATPKCRILWERAQVPNPVHGIGSSPHPEQAIRCFVITKSWCRLKS